MHQERQETKTTPPLFHSCLVHSDGYKRVSFTGELDLATQPQAVAALEAASKGLERSVLVVDLQALDFMDCSGLNALIAAATALRAQGGELLVCLPDRGVVRRIFDILDGQLDLTYDNPSRAFPSPAESAVGEPCAC